MSDTTYISSPRECSFCQQDGTVRQATVDGKTIFGGWAYMCDEHFKSHGIGLGTGKGQKLIVGERPTVTADERAAWAKAALADGDLESFEEAVGDGDPADYL